jgi:hypothetical protein
MLYCHSFMPPACLNCKSTAATYMSLACLYSLGLCAVSCHQVRRLPASMYADSLHLCHWSALYAVGLPQVSSSSPLLPSSSLSLSLSMLSSIPCFCRALTFLCLCDWNSHYSEIIFLFLLSVCSKTTLTGEFRFHRSTPQGF